MTSKVNMIVEPSQPSHDDETAITGLRSFQELSDFFNRAPSIGSLSVDDLDDDDLVEDDTVVFTRDFNERVDAGADVDDHGAAEDFALHLKIWGKSSFDEEAFNMLLDDIGYKPCRAGLFDDFLQDIANCKPARQEKQNKNAPKTAGNNDRSVSLNDLRRLYRSEPYRLFQEQKLNNGEASLSYVEYLLNQADLDKSGELNRDEVRLFLSQAMADDKDEPKDLSKELIDEAFQAMDLDGNGSVSMDEFKSVLLKANEDDNSKVSKCFDDSFLSPALTPLDEFITKLESFSKNHRAVTHHLLTNLACASFGKDETFIILLKFITAYQAFNSRFISSPHSLIKLIDDETHIQILEENLKEEMGHYDEGTLRELESKGICRESVVNITHHSLFIEMIQCLESKLGRSYKQVIPDTIYKKLTIAVDTATKMGKMGLLASLYFASELIVPLIYSSILRGLQHSICEISNQDARFLILRIDMDSDHAQKLREIVIANCRTKEDRATLVKCTEMLLDARVGFYDELIAYHHRSSVLTQNMHERDTSNTATLNASGSSNDPSNTGTIYNKQAKKWSRNKPVCLSDFTGRPIVFKMCKEHIALNGEMNTTNCTASTTILDVGCGEGYVARKLMEMGAGKIVGVDISSGMVESANGHPSKSKNEYYIVGDVANLMETIVANANTINLMRGDQFKTGCFDLSVGVFVFNYVTITEMNKTFRDVFSLLKPGGHFVFSVPHPFMANHESDNFGFGGGCNNTSGESGSCGNAGKRTDYFTLRDRILEGHINTLDGERLKVRMYCKTFEDYFKAALDQGFEIVEMEEARVTPNHMDLSPSFFDSVNGVPLHLVVKVRKPDRYSQSRGKSPSPKTGLRMLPKKIQWSRAIFKHPHNAFCFQIPPEVQEELRKVALDCYDQGISVEEIGRSYAYPQSSSLTHVREFAASIRNAVMNQTGVAVLKALDLDAFGGMDNMEKMTSCAKMAYFLICDHIGIVDGAARGRLFDVKCANLDAMSKQADNVLFSVSNCEAGWHTDGASKDRSYDIASLLCISPAAIGGKSKISNASNVFDDISKNMPKFLMHELLRPLPRDVLENGSGKGVEGIGIRLRRLNSILPLRICYNSYPIYVVEDDRMRFRYMRHWIETAHERLRLKVPTLLRIAMDVLDDALDKECCFYETLGRGDILVVNNGCIAHARDSFKNLEGKPSRHLVRAWIQAEK